MVSTNGASTVGHEFMAPVRGRGKAQKIGSVRRKGKGRGGDVLRPVRVAVGKP